MGDSGPGDVPSLNHIVTSGLLPLATQRMLGLGHGLLTRLGQSLVDVGRGQVDLMAEVDQDPPFACLDPAVGPGGQSQVGDPFLGLTSVTRAWRLALAVQQVVDLVRSEGETSAGGVERWPKTAPPITSARKPIPKAGWMRKRRGIR